MSSELSQDLKGKSSVNVALVNSICVRGDAISEAVRGTAFALSEKIGAKCKLFTYACDYKDLSHRIVSGPLDILSDFYFQNSDIIIYHFGIHYDLFDTILLAPTAARKFVRYHNITPKNLVAKSSHRLIDKSLAQRANVSFADEIWADSAYNKQDLVEYGVDPDKITISPLFVKFSGVPERVKRRADEPIELLYVGRFVASKGLIDLLEAIDAIRSVAPPFRLRLIGNVDFSDPSYIALIQNSIKSRGLDQIVIFDGKVDDETLTKRYAEADAFVIASYHEGFCVPLIEAMRFGCVPIAYDAGNMANLVADYGSVVPTGDVAALSRAIATVVADVSTARRRGDSARIRWGRQKISWRSYRAKLKDYVGQFEYEAYAERVSSRVSKQKITAK